jgi:hypothetical protein
MDAPYRGVSVVLAFDSLMYSDRRQPGLEPISICTYTAQNVSDSVSSPYNKDTYKVSLTECSSQVLGVRCFPHPLSFLLNDILHGHREHRVNEVDV